MSRVDVRLGRIQPITLDTSVMCLEAGPIALIGYLFPMP